MKKNINLFSSYTYWQHLQLTCQTPLLKSSVPAINATGKRRYTVYLHRWPAGALQNLLWQAKLLWVLTNAGTLAYFLINFMKLKRSQTVLKFTKLQGMVIRTFVFTYSYSKPWIILTALPKVCTWIDLETLFILKWYHRTSPRDVGLSLFFLSSAFYFILLKVIELIFLRWWKLKFRFV